MKIYRIMILPILMGILMISAQYMQASPYGTGTFGECEYGEDCTVTEPDKPGKPPKKPTGQYGVATPTEEPEETVVEEEETELPPTTVSPPRPNTPTVDDEEDLGVLDKCYQWTILGISLCWYWWIVIAVVIATILLIILVYQGMKEDQEPNRKI